MKEERLKQSFSELAKQISFVEPYLTNSNLRLLRQASLKPAQIPRNEPVFA
jgi:hypothetical protein